MHWDPFTGESPPAPPPAVPEGSSPPTRNPVTALTVGAMVLGFVVIAVEMIFLPDLVIEGFPIVGSALVGLGVAGMVLFDSTKEQRASLDPVLAEIARANGWSFKTIRQRRRITSGMDNPASGGTSIDPAMKEAYAQIAPLLAPRFGDLVPVNPQALYWGQIDGRDLWLGAEQMSSLNLPGQNAKQSLATLKAGTGAVHRYIIGLRLTRPMPCDALIHTIDPHPKWQDAGILDDPLRLSVPDGTTETDIQVLRDHLRGPATAKIAALQDRAEARVMIRPDALFVALKDNAHQTDGGPLPARVRALVQECAGLAAALEQS